MPVRLDRSTGAPQVEWVFTDGARFTEPFFEQTIARLTRQHPANRPAQRPRTPLDALRNVPPGVPPAGFIFHVSRCGSTLVAQMLAALRRNIVVSEAPIIDDVLQTVRHDPRVTDAQRIAWLRGAVHALGAPQPDAMRLFVKLDCWHIFSLPLIRRAFPEVPMIFLYREPVEVLVSLLRMPGLTLVRDVVSPAQLGLSREERDALSPAAHAAAILGAFFRAAREHRDDLVPAAYERLPDFVWQTMPGIKFTAEECTRLREVSTLDAKNPGRHFISDTTSKRREAAAEIRAASARWAEPAFHAWLAVAIPPRLSSAV